MRPHVLLARLDNTGDVLLSGPATRAAARGASRVTYLCSPAGEAAAAMLPGVDQVIVTPAPWVAADPPPLERAAVESLVERLSQMGIDQGAVLTSFHQSPLPLALLLRMAGVGTIAAVSTDYPGSLLDHRLVEQERHEVLRDLEVVAALGHDPAPGDDGRLAVALPAGTTLPRPLRRRLAPDARYVVVHPGASVPARAWGAERMRELVGVLVRSGRLVVVTGAAHEAELTSFVAGGEGAVDAGGATTLAQLALVLAGSDAVVTGNTGPAHLAAAVGTPVVSIFAPTVPALRWRPWAVEHVLLGDQAISCAGCRARQCPREGHPCVEGVGVDQVEAALDSLVDPAREAPVPAGRGPGGFGP